VRKDRLATRLIAICRVCQNIEIETRQMSIHWCIYSPFSVITFDDRHAYVTGSIRSADGCSHSQRTFS